MNLQIDQFNSAKIVKDELTATWQQVIDPPQ
jgi:hypothetical protein